MSEIKTSRTAENRIIDFDAVSTSSGRFGVIVQKSYFSELDLEPSKGYIMELWNINDDMVASFTEYHDFIKYHRMKGISLFQHEIEEKVTQVYINMIYEELRSYVIQRSCFCISYIDFIIGSIDGLPCLIDRRIEGKKYVLSDRLRQIMRFNYEKNKIRIV